MSSPVIVQVTLDSNSPLIITPNNPPSATNPATGMLGDTYYNTVLNQYMYYDDSRSSWVSVSSYNVVFSRRGNVGVGTWLYSSPNVIGNSSQNRGVVVPQCLITGYSASNNNGNPVDIEVLNSDTNASLFTASLTSLVSNTSLSVAFPLGKLSARIQGSNTANTPGLNLVYRLII